MRREVRDCSERTDSRRSRRRHRRRRQSGSRKRFDWPRTEAEEAVGASSALSARFVASIRAKKHFLVQQ